MRPDVAMRSARLLAGGLALLAGAARAQPAAHGSTAPGAPAVCPTAPSTLTIDVGAYHGSVWITDAGGKPAFEGGTRFECPASVVKHAWESCNFSVCHLPDGDYGFRFSRLAPESRIDFTLEHGMLRLAPTPLAVQAGNYGLDATGSRVEVAFDLRGYDGPWGLEGWPGGAFHGTDTGGRGRLVGGLVVLSLYPATPYAVRFGDRPGAVITAGFDGAVRLAAPAAGGTGRPLKRTGGRLLLRGAPVTVAPVAAGAVWHVAGGNAVPGKLTFVMPAGAALTLFDETHATSQVLSLDDACRPSLAPAPGGAVFTVAPVTQGCAD